MSDKPTHKISPELSAKLLAQYDEDQKANPQTLEQKKADISALYGPDSEMLKWADKLIEAVHRKLKAYGWIK